MIWWLDCLLKIIQKINTIMFPIHKTPQVLSSELFIKSAEFSGFFFLIEGDFDQKFWSNFKNDLNLKLINCEGKSNLLGLLGFPELNSHTYNWIALLDKDYDQILNRQSTVSNLVYTDLNDLEVTLLCICSSRNHLLINKILNVSIDTEKQINFESKIGVPVVEHIRQITSNYGVLRFINEKNQYGVNFDNLPLLHNSYFDARQLIQCKTVLQQKFINEVNLAGKTTLTQEQLEAEITRHVCTDLLSGWDLVQGHDLMKLLAVSINSDALKKASDHVPASEKSLTRDLCLIHLAELSTSKMFNQLDSFGKQAGLELFN